MESQNESFNKPQRDFTIPLLISGAISTVLCIAFCAVLYLSRDFINDDLVPRLGLAEPTSAPMKCPLVQDQWKIKMADRFDKNQFEWPIGGESHTNIKDGHLALEITPSEPVLINPTPRSNASLTDFYLTIQMRQISELEFNEYGIMFRADGSDVYFFNIHNNKTAVLQKWNPSENWDPPAYSEYPITIKPGEMNELAVFNSGSHAVFCVNGNMAFERDDIGSIFGSFGVAVSMGQEEQKASFEFDDFKLYVPASTSLSCPRVPAGWEMAMDDNFNTNKYDWPVGKNTDFYADTGSQVANGLLQINILPHHSVYFPQTPRINSTQQNFYATTQARKVKGPDNAKYGLAFRINGDQTLFFAIQEPGTVLLYGRDVDRFWQNSLFNEDVKNINVGEMNELVVIGQGSRYTFCLNRSVLMELDNSDYLFGEFGLAVDMLVKDDEESIFEFDDFIVYAPAE